MNTAIFPLTGDPVHYGHLAVIEKAARLCDKLYVALGVNPEKAGKHLFSEDERVRLVKNAVGTLSLEAEVEVGTFHGLLAQYALSKGADFIARSVRDAKDTDYELLLAEFNSGYGLDTVILPLSGVDGKIKNASSSMLKLLAGDGCLVHDYTAPMAKQALEEKIRKVSIIGVTGLMGSGKSTFCRQLCEYASAQGVSVTHVDCDAVAHSMYSSSSEYYPAVRNAIVSEFGEEVCEGNSINRKALAKKALLTNESRLRLMKVLEAPFRAKIEGIIAGTKGVLLLDAAYLDMMLPWVNYNVLLVKCDEDERKKRVFARGHMDDEAYARLSSYLLAPDAFREKLQQEQARHRHGLLYEIDSGKADYKEALEWIQTNFPMF